MSAPHPIEPRHAVGALSTSKIREVANAGLERSDVLTFWFGEPDEVTPEVIRDAGRAALAEGATFYTSNLGIGPLRAALAGYQSDLHRPIASERIVVTSSGMSALMIALQTLVSPGDRVVVVTPVWPNLVEGPKILGGQVVSVPLECHEGRWQLDLERVLAALTEETRILVINSPNNPTGWVIGREAQIALLEHCRQRGIWIIADDVYERIVFSRAPGARAAPSFLDIADPEDRLVVTNSFSKSWLMTGWRLGWVTSPEGRDGTRLTEHFGKLIEYNTSCAPDFVQRAAQVAVEVGEPIVERTVERLRRARDHLCARLATVPGVHCAPPDGAMYLFFSLEGAHDSLALCKALVTEVGLGLAPGAAFGPEGEGYLRWCIASSLERLDEGVSRLVRFLEHFQAPGAKPGWALSPARAPAF